MDDAIVELDRLTKHYGSVVAVQDVSLCTRPGEIFAMLGPNGAGKTTTIRMLMGILKPTSGTARIAGLDCSAERAQVMRRVGYVPDTPMFYDYLTGREIIRFVGELHGLADGLIRERGDALSSRLGLADDLDEFAVNYSRGMGKKLAMVCALLHEPSVLILDEPSSGLDPLVTRTLHDIIREQAAAGRMIFFSTHLLDQAERLCHRVGILHKGRLAAVGPLDELRGRLAVGGSLEEVFFAVAGEGGPSQVPIKPLRVEPAPGNTRQDRGTDGSPVDQASAQGQDAPGTHGQDARATGKQDAPPAPEGKG